MAYTAQRKLPLFLDSLEFYFYNISLSNCAQFCATMRATRLTRTYRCSGVQVQIFKSTHNKLISQSLFEYGYCLPHLYEKDAA